MIVCIICLLYTLYSKKLNIQLIEVAFNLGFILIIIGFFLIHDQNTNICLILL